MVNDTDQTHTALDAYASYGYAPEEQDGSSIGAVHDCGNVPRPI